jgi:hypothetical protein
MLSWLATQSNYDLWQTRMPGDFNRVCLELVDDGQRRLEHEAAKSREGAEHEVREGGCPVASRSSRFASFAPLRVLA